MAGATVPPTARVIEVGPRDGFQMESTFLPTELKVELIDRLSASGLREIEVTSFVSPTVIPQLRDAAEVVATMRRRPGVRYSALVPNRRGAERALDAGIDALHVVVCVTESYNRRNVGLSVDESLRQLAQIVDRAGGVPVAATAAAFFGCPFEGRLPDEQLVDLARRFADTGIDELGLADSVGLGDPFQVRGLLRAVRTTLPQTPLRLHLHDTRGLGLANAAAGLEEGVGAFDTAFGGLGGCPVVRGASGNVATEDFVWLCQEAGIETGVDLDAVRSASRSLEELLGRDLPSRILRAGTGEELRALNRASR